MKDNINMVNVQKNRKKINVRLSRLKRKVLTHVTLVRGLVVFFFLIFFVGIGFWSVKTWNKLNASLYIKSLYNFWKAPITALASSNDRTNIVIMGKAGGVHDGPDLTDTIMVASVSLKSPDVKIISIPRDTWIPDIRAKINSAYYWGNQKQVGGINFAKAEVSGVVGLPIHYGAVIDFSGFKDVIDELGGITVDVANSFTDYYYPVAGKENDTCNGDLEYMCRYETLTFNKGLTKMDGETALKYVRSRHALGVEGTDIAREARQQKVIEAVKNKLLDKNTYKNLKRDIAILKVVLNSVQTDFDYPTAAIIARRAYDAKSSISSHLIPAELLVNPPISDKYDMQSVFIPKAGNGKWQDIQKWVEDILKK